MSTLGIGDVATRLGLDADTLRWFERRGVVPHPERDAGGRRRDTEDVLAGRRRVDASLAVMDRKIATYTRLLAASASPATGG